MRVHCLPIRITQFELGNKFKSVGAKMEPRPPAVIRLRNGAAAGIRGRAGRPVARPGIQLLIMKRLGLILALGLLTLCGCSSAYVMKLSNGARIVTPSKPKLKNGNYYYKDARGEVNVVPQTRVQEIEPTSMAEEESKFTPQKPKTHHWWKFW